MEGSCTNLIITLWLLLFVRSQYALIFYVNPDISTNSSCPQEYPCYDIETYVNNSSSYFISNASFIFLPGVHRIDTLIYFENISNLLISGSLTQNLNSRLVADKVKEYGLDSYPEDSTISYTESTVILSCKGASGLGFFNITNLTMNDLMIVNCGTNFFIHLKAGILLQNIYNLIISGISIQNSSGYGVYGRNVVGKSLIINSSFVGNNQCAQCINSNLMDSDSNYGGNMLLMFDQSYLKTDSKLLVSSCLFTLGMNGRTNDTCGGSGLSISFHNTTAVTVIISNTVSYRNTAGSGANFFFFSNISSFNLFVQSISSIKGIGGGFQYTQEDDSKVGIPSSVAITGSKFVNSAFSCETSFNVTLSLTNCTIESSSVKIQNVKSQVLISNSSFYDSAAALICDNREEVYLNNNSLFRKSPIEIRTCEVHIENCEFMTSRVQVFKSRTFFQRNVAFEDNSGNQRGGALYLLDSTANFESSTVKFFNNTAINGGAIYVGQQSFLNLSSQNNLTFMNNTAVLAGGAIYVESLPFITCFFKLNGLITMYYNRNEAGEAGSVLYGGNIDFCDVDKLGATITIDSSNNTSVISSEPFNICPCTPGDALKLPTIRNISDITEAIKVGINPCLNTFMNISVYPGQRISIPFITYGQANGIAPGIVLIYRNNTNNINLISSIRSSATCLNYNIPYVLQNGTQYITTQTSFGDSSLSSSQIILSITVLSCPFGFMLDTSTQSCVCDILLKKYNHNCTIGDLTVERNGKEWIGHTENFSVLGHYYMCPYDYCIASKVVTLNSLCAFNRTNTFCGQCQDGLSMTFGSSKCKKCGNESLALIIVFAFMGIVLVVATFLLNLTVSMGTMIGIVYFANIIKVNEEIFFLQPMNSSLKTLADLLSIFIAWMNLDLGIETCFYNGMDSYAKTWLQFVFPAYMFCIVVIIIVAGRCSSRISRLCKFNAVQVLATLVLASYSKILRTIIIVFSSAMIDTVDAKYQSRLWLYDGTVKFFVAKHAIISIFGITVCIFFIIPFTMVLLCIPCLQSRSHWKAFRFFNRCKPFFDSFAAPYKDRYRFWPGVLLLVRIILYGLFTVDNITLRLLAIIFVSHFYTAVLCRFSVYRSWVNVLLEVYFHSNLSILAIAYLLDEGFGVSLYPVVFIIGIGSAYLCLDAFVVFHAYRRIISSENHKWSVTQLWKKFKAMKNKSLSTSEVRVEPQNRRSSFTELRESLLEI